MKKNYKGKIEIEVDWGKRIMIGLIRMYFIIFIFSSDKYGYFELYDNVINMFLVGIYIWLECYNRCNEKYRE